MKNKMFKNMGGNIPGGTFLGGHSLVENLIGGKFTGGDFRGDFS